MASYAILRFSKRKAGGVASADRHNERKKAAYKSNPNIDRSRSKYNYHLVEPSGTYKEGAENGHWIYYYETGEKWREGNYEDGLRQGTWTTYYENGKKLHEGNYVDGLEEGKWVAWQQDGNIDYQGSFKEGLKDGEWTGYYPNGKTRYIINYRKDKKHGKEVKFFENGRKNSECEYKDGLENGLWTNYDATTGKVQETGNFSDGQKNGKWTFYNNLGGIAREQVFTNGLPDGAVTEYHNNGKKSAVGQYKDVNGVSLRVGTWTYYDQYGDETMTMKFEDGYMVSKDVKKKTPQEQQQRRRQDGFKAQKR